MNLDNLHVLIVDDEPDGIDYIVELLRTYFPTVQHLHTAENLIRAREILTHRKMDLLFLDIRMQDSTVFKLLNEGDLFTDEVLIFVTGHKEYAFEAIRTRPFDYLLKPLSPKEFVQCMDKCLQYLTEQKSRKSISDKVLVLSGSGRQYTIRMSQILYCRSMGAYTSFVLRSGKSIMVSKAMNHFQEELEENGFYRIHNSYVANLKHIDSVASKGSTHVVLTNGDTLPVSRRRRPGFNRVFNGEVRRG
ncbi:MAG: response regulator transcription factor [Bacteroidetes bacterium]|nr:MAG: response regulator transcription factor [Bacteroidota bacterium]